jgi:hypothetical protein
MKTLTSWKPHHTPPHPHPQRDWWQLKGNCEPQSIHPLKKPTVNSQLDIFLK